MSESVSVNATNVLYTVVFGGFIAIKLAGTSLVAWSWWWLLMPIVPVLSLAVKHFGL